MTPRLRLPSTFRTLRVAVLPPVLPTTAVLGAYGISCASGIPPGHVIRSPHGIRSASYTVQPTAAHARLPYDGRTPDTAARQTHITLVASAAAASEPPPTVLPHTPGRSASAEATGIAEPSRKASVTPTPAAAPGHKATSVAAHPPAPKRPVAAHPPGPARPSASRPDRPSPDASRAGSQAGEGRIRPGRPEDVPQSQSPDEADEPTYTDHDPTAPEDAAAAPEDPDRTAPGTTETMDAGTEASGTGTGMSTGGAGFGKASPAAPSQGSAVLAREAGASEPVVEILPLGSGLVLIGLGLGLALLALRLRRG